MSADPKASEVSPPVAPFDIAGPLPSVGTTLLEASAGTGKTWTIGALVARYVAEGVATLGDMLVITFGRAASLELRDRVRAQLVDLERALAGDPRAPRTEVVDVVLGPPEQPLPADEVRRRHRRVRAALSDFDAATIVTTHQFCQTVLRGLGVAGDTDPHARLVEDLEELRTEVVDDLWWRREDLDDPLVSHAQAMVVASEACADPRARLEPADAPPDTVPGARVAFAEAVRAELDVRKRRLGILSYDDLLTRLADTLAPVDAPARARMRARWSVVLVDEFQDTDPVQWQVLERAFAGVATVVLIGDPKQAIYAFRGGDVATYLRATESVTVHQTLDRNYRSDPGVVRAVGRLLEGAELGDPRIAVRPVAAHRETERLVGAGAPFRLRVMRPGTVRGGRGEADRVRARIVTDVVDELVTLLASGATYDGRAVRPADVAILARTHSTLEALAVALAARGIPAVVAGGGSVFRTPAAGEWVTLLEALEQPHRSARVRAAALTSFVGSSAAELDAEGDELTDRVAARMRGWAELLTQRGLAAVMEAAASDGLTARVLARPDGDRHLTDLRHLAQLLHEVASEEGMGPVALLAWLREQCSDDRTEVPAERTRRLESDAHAVQLMTIHASKGLEFPIVYAPQLWDRYVSEPTVPRFHDADGQRARDIGGRGRDNPQWDSRAAAHLEEESAESLRLLYVALTRAGSQVVAWWAPTYGNTAASPLQRVLFGRAPGWSTVPASRPVDDEPTIERALATWQEAGGPSWEWIRDRTAPTPPVEDSAEPLAVRRFDRPIDLGWRRTSYSALSGAAQAAGHAHGSWAPTSEPEQPPLEDEPDAGGSAAPLTSAGERDDPAYGVASPMADLPVGATFGSLVHAVLEHADPQAADLAVELHRHLDEHLVQWPVDVDRDALVTALAAVVTTPLGPLAGGLSLAAIPLSDRLAELDFELPLAGGDGAGAASASRVRLGDLGPLLRSHLPPGDPLLPYADRLADPALGGQELRGYLTGSIDVVLRLPGPRFVVVDYKTNWLGESAPGDPEAPTLSAGDYRPAALDAAMGGSDYPLQALLYAVVLHRYLRWRLPGYDPAEHLAGVQYLYLRGMCGPDTPRLDGGVCGVFSWRPPAALVRAVSDLLDGRREQGGRR